MNDKDSNFCDKFLVDHLNLLILCFFDIARERNI